MASKHNWCWWCVCVWFGLSVFAGWRLRLLLSPRSRRRQRRASRAEDNGVPLLALVLGRQPAGRTTKQRRRAQATPADRAHTQATVCASQRQTLLLLLPSHQHLFGRESSPTNKWREKALNASVRCANKTLLGAGRTVPIGQRRARLHAQWKTLTFNCAQAPFGRKDCLSRKLREETL